MRLASTAMLTSFFVGRDLSQTRSFIFRCLLILCPSIGPCESFQLILGINFKVPPVRSGDHSEMPFLTVVRAVFVAALFVIELLANHIRPVSCFVSELHSFFTPKLPKYRQIGTSPWPPICPGQSPGTWAPAP